MMDNTTIKCKDCIYSYKCASGSNCPSSIIEEYGLPLHCIVDGYEMIQDVHEEFSCDKGIRRV